MSEMTVWFAFTAGILSFFSPCIFPLIPAYVTHLTGNFIENNRIDVNKRILMIRSIAFILGFSIVFILMGASASFLGQLFVQHRELIEKISGILIVIFGLQMAEMIHIKFLNMTQASKFSKGEKSKSAFGSMLLGIAFASGWTPCVGLALSSILLLASSADTLSTGVIMLGVYSLGIGIPFLMISLGITYSLNIVRKVNRYLPIIAKVNGWIMVGLGILVYSGQMQKISAWLSQFNFFSY